jgi:hypothetical protein
MPCLFVLAALAAPRVVVVMLWLFTHWFDLFRTPLWPVLGFVFLPTTLLWYAAVQHWFHGQWSLWPVVGLVIALMIDVSPAGGRRNRRR